MLKFQYFGNLMQRVDSSKKTLRLEKIEGKRRRQQRMRWFDSIVDSMDVNLSKFGEKVKGREAWSAAVHGITESQDTTEEQHPLFYGHTTLKGLHLIRSQKLSRVGPG